MEKLPQTLKWSAHLYPKTCPIVPPSVLLLRLYCAVMQYHGTDLPELLQYLFGKKRLSPWPPVA